MPIAVPTRVVQSCSTTPLFAVDMVIVLPHPIALVSLASQVPTVNHPCATTFPPHLQQFAVAEVLVMLPTIALALVASLVPIVKTKLPILLPALAFLILIPVFAQVEAIAHKKTLVLASPVLKVIVARVPFALVSAHLLAQFVADMDCAICQTTVLVHLVILDSNAKL